MLMLISSDILIVIPEIRISYSTQDCLQACVHGAGAGFPATPSKHTTTLMPHPKMP